MKIKKKIKVLIVDDSIVYRELYPKEFQLIQVLK